MPKYRILTKEEEIQIIDLYKTNTLCQTARKFNTSDKIVLTVLNKYNVSLHTKENDDKIKKLNRQAAGANKPDEEKLRHNKLISKKVKAAYDNYTEEDGEKFKQIRKIVENNKTADKRCAAIEKGRATQKKNWLAKSAEEKEFHAKKTSLGLKNRSDIDKKNTQLKRCATMNSRYGADYLLQNEQLRLKCFETKRKNKSFNSSSEEEKLYLILANQFGEENVLRQYNLDERYPFNCDFYIKNKDMFIELNLSWTHGNKPFTGDNDDILKLERGENKAINSKYYQNAITTGTKRDVEKLNFATQNNLNYFVIYKSEYDRIILNNSFIYKE